jgi:sec-independent protein translocase protein TatC
MPAVRPIGHEERISIVDHLDELRSRLILIIAVLAGCFAFCYWQNHAILEIVNQPLADAQRTGGEDSLQQSQRFDLALDKVLKQLAPALDSTRKSLESLAAEPGVSADAKLEASRASQQLAEASAVTALATKAVPTDRGRRPLTLGVAEPFVATFTVAAYAALLLALPFILWQIYAFILPAFDPKERKIVIPMMALIPMLFAAGVLFGYYGALPRAVDFLQNYNSGEFDIQIQARDYYRFVVLFLALMGLAFQIPVGVLVLTRTGVVDARTLWKRQGYVILGIAIVAAIATPTPDPVTMLVTMVPLILLYELSIGLAYIFRPRGGTITSRWGEWWDEDDEQELLAADLAAEEGADAEHDQTPVS